MHITIMAHVDETRVLNKYVSIRVWELFLSRYMFNTVSPYHPKVPMLLCVTEVMERLAVITEMN